MSNDREYFEEIREHVFAEAVTNNLEVVIPTASQIQMDYDRTWPRRVDTIQGLEVLPIIHDDDRTRIKIVDRFLQEVVVVKFEAWRSAGGNCHVMLTLAREFLPAERVAIQAIMGSDPMREFLNLRRVMCEATDPIALFRPKSNV